MRWLVLGLLVSSLVAATTASAQGGSNKAAAEALFLEGRSLMAEGRFEEACPKFRASQELDPGLGTMLNLADCLEKVGKTASAWAEYREAIPVARAAGSEERLELAQERVRALESRLSTLTIRAMGGDPPSPGLEVRRDGLPVQRAELGTPIPVDPGTHEIEARAPGKQAWSTSVEVGPDAARVEVEIPPLADAAASVPATAPASLASDPGVASSSGSSQRTIGLVVGGAGVVGLAVGTLFGVNAGESWSDAKSGCDAYPYSCSEKALEDRDAAKSQATIATIGFIAGGALLATGAVLWLTASGDGEAAPEVGVGPSGVLVRGSF